MLPPRIPKKPKRESRWRSQRHLAFVRSHACAGCGSMAGIQAAHVRIESGAGMGQKPHDWQTVSLCGNCHAEQHRVGEWTFWGHICCSDGTTRWERGDPFALIDAYCKASPVAREIREVRNG